MLKTKKNKFTYLFLKILNLKFPITAQNHILFEKFAFEENFPKCVLGDVSRKKEKLISDELFFLYIYAHFICYAFKFGIMFIPN